MSTPEEKKVKPAGPATITPTHIEIDPRLCDWATMRTAAATAGYNLKSFVLVTDLVHSSAEKALFAHMCCEAMYKIEKDKPTDTKKLKLVMMSGNDITCALKMFKVPVSDIGAVLVSQHAPDRRKVLQDLETRGWLKKGTLCPDGTYILCNLLRKDAEGNPMVAIMM